MKTETCGRCRIPLVFTADELGRLWQHETEPAISHTPILGTLTDWAPVRRSDVAPEPPATPVPEPEVRSEVIESWGRDERVPRAAVRFVKAVQRTAGNLGSDIRVTYARGPLIGANGKVLRERCESILVRVEARDAHWFASWLTKEPHPPLAKEWENEGAWGATDDRPWSKWGTKEILTYLKEH